MNKVFACTAVMLILASSALCGDASYDRVIASRKGFKYPLGPTGIRYRLTKNPLAKEGKIGDCILVHGVEPESPAARLIQEDDVILAANGKPFSKDGDVRAKIAYAIVDSESSDGKLRLQVYRTGQVMEVTILLDRVPDYSPTWPFDCKRTDIMLNNACEYLVAEQLPKGYVVSDDGLVGPNLAGLLWIATGEPRYLENAARAAYWYADRVEEGHGGWSWGYAYGGVFLAEYYQMTGDRGILPGLEGIVEKIVRGQMPSGGWSHGFFGGYSAGYGEVNNTGMVCYMALLLAKECGVKVDEGALRRATKYYEKFAPTLTNRYGDHIYQETDCGYGLMNGKVGGMAVAHRLNGREEDSAGYALKASRGFDNILSGHTGPFFNILWSPIAASHAPAKEYRRAMDEFGWFYVLARSAQGSLTGSAGMDYIRNTSTGGIALPLAAPRRHLRILGASKSVFVRKLPAALEAARELHQSRQWDKAIAAVDAFLKTDGLDPETVRLANELRDKSRYVKEGVDLGIAKLDKLASGGKMGAFAYDVDQMLKPYRAWLGKDHSRLLAIEQNLPEKWRRVWTIGKYYYEGMESFQTIRREVWWRHYNRMLNESLKDVEFAMAHRHAPTWTILADMAEKSADLKRLAVPKPADAPADWTSLSFDDSTWAGKRKGKPGKSDGQGKYSMVRYVFDLGKVSVKELRVSLPGKGRFQPGDEVYLNGERVLMAPGTEPMKHGITDSRVLLRKARLLLREGRNVLACASIDGTAEGWKLEAILAPDYEAFAWTQVPGRDAEFRTLTATRDQLHPYYQADKDTRTVDQLMKVFQAEPYFMPAGYYALERYNVLAPDMDEKLKHVTTLLKSPSWGARWIGLTIINEALVPIQNKDIKELSKEEGEEVLAEKEAKRPKYDVFVHEVVGLLKDPHPQVRCRAAEVLGNYAAPPKDAIPMLMALLADVNGQNWWVRYKAIAALSKMPLDGELKRTVYQTGLNDPNSKVRRTAVDQTFWARDPAVVEESAKLFRDEMIDQMFDAPYGMSSGSIRKKMAPLLLAHLSKEDLRPYLPRFFEALADPKGGTLSSSMSILVSFGDEVVEELESLFDSENQTVRYNALEACQMILLNGDGSPELAAKVRDELTSIKEVFDAKVAQAQEAEDMDAWTAALQQSGWAGRLLEQLDEKKKR